MGKNNQSTVALNELELHFNQLVLEALQRIRYGSITIIKQDNQIIQINTNEKISVI